MSVSWKIASVSAGRIMCSQPSSVNRPELHQPNCTVSPRPKLGSQPSQTEKIRISRMPIRKVGSDTPSSDTVMNTWLRKLPRRSAAYTPIGMPMISASTAATRASSKVAGKRSPSRRETLAPWRSDRPNSPCAAFSRKCQNCTKKG